MSFRLLARKPVGKVRLDTSSTNITTSAWTTITETIPAGTTAIEIFNSSSSVIKLSTGTAGNEDASELNFYVLPGGTEGLIPIELSKNARLAGKAVDTSATVGQIVINFYG